MLPIKYCSGCTDNFYNHGEFKGCWNRKTGKVVWRIPVGYWEEPPYLDKKRVRVADCRRETGSGKTTYIKPEAITERGYWKAGLFG